MPELGRTLSCTAKKYTDRSAMKNPGSDEPKKVITEARLSNVEATANTVASSVTDVELAMTELYEMIAGGN